MRRAQCRSRSVGRRARPFASRGSRDRASARDVVAVRMMRRADMNDAREREGGASSASRRRARAMGSASSRGRWGVGMRARWFVAACVVTGARAKPRLEILNSAHDMAHVSHILCGNGDAGKQKCHDYAEMLTPYADESSTLERAFAQLARRYSECPTGSSGGDLGYFPRGEMSRDFESVVFDSKTPVETVVGPVETRNGWHVMLIHHRHLADEDAKERARLRSEEMRKERMARAEEQKKYQEERARRKAERASKPRFRDSDHSHSLHRNERDHMHERLYSMHDEL